MWNQAQTWPCVCERLCGCMHGVFVKCFLLTNLFDRCLGVNYCLHDDNILKLIPNVILHTFYICYINHKHSDSLSLSCMYTRTYAPHTHTHTLLPATKCHQYKFWSTSSRCENFNSLPEELLRKLFSKIPILFRMLSAAIFIFDSR